MRRLAIGTAIFGIVAAATVGFAGVATAAPLGGEDALNAVNQLRAQGYSVSVHVTNGPREVPLSECTVLDVSGLNGTNSEGKPLTPAELGTVYVDANCPEDDD
jgi:hypothetical protein